MDKKQFKFDLKDDQIKKHQSVIESMLFVWGDPLSISKISQVLNIKLSYAEMIMQDLMYQYQENNRGIQIIETNKHYQFSTLKDNYPYIQEMCATSKSKGLSNAAFEVLAIIAYKQPITKIDIEQIRGVNSDAAMQSLIERDLITIKGKLERIGRPLIYGTTDEFLKQFGFKNIESLPPIDEFELFDQFESEKPANDVEVENDSDR